MHFGAPPDEEDQVIPEAEPEQEIEGQEKFIEGNQIQEVKIEMDDSGYLHDIALDGFGTGTVKNIMEESDKPPLEKVVKIVEPTE